MNNPRIPLLLASYSRAHMPDSLDPFDCDGIWDACLSLWPFNSHPLQTHITKGIPGGSVLISLHVYHQGLHYYYLVGGKNSTIRPSCHSEIDSIKMWENHPGPVLISTHPIYLIPAREGPLLGEQDYKLQGSAPRDKWQRSPHMNDWLNVIPCRFWHAAARENPPEKTIKADEGSYSPY